MSNLSKETIARIASDAVKSYPLTASHTHTDGPRAGYTKGALHEAERAQDLVDALEQIDKRIDGFKSGATYKIEMIKPLVKAALAKYKEVTK
jgi:hypothetical protein